MFSSTLDAVVTILALLPHGAASAVIANKESHVPNPVRAEEIPNLQRRVTNSTPPDPIVASVSQYWEGNDGTWSTFAIQVGKQPQNIRVLPSTASSSSWVVYDQGCPADAPSNCIDSRGGIFNPNKSLTWVPNSIFGLGVETYSDLEVFGDFGFDTMTLGWQGSGGPTVEHSIIAGIGDTSFSWLGTLGLNPRPTNFSTMPNNPQVSFVQSLKNQNSIPSVSWAYTAGASYRLNKVYGSLVLGGYDASRFRVPPSTSSDLSFDLYTDVSRDLLVGISSITTSNTVSSTSEQQLLQDGIYAFIDSTLPHLRLPVAICKAFEAAFGLVWNSTSELYILNSTQHDKLLNLNPSVSFTLSPTLPAASLNESVTITLPYAAFDLNTSWPHAASSSYYFPLKQAANNDQIVLGRAFLQEAYLIADYERQNFSIWPCTWEENTIKAEIIAIDSLDAVKDPAPTPIKTNTSLKPGVIAGIAVGAAALVIGSLLAAFIWWRRRQRPPVVEVKTGPFTDDSAASSPISPTSFDKVFDDAQELGSEPRHEMAGHHKYGPFEAPHRPKFEMEGAGMPQEVGGEARSVHELPGNTHFLPRIRIQAPPTEVSMASNARSMSPVPALGGNKDRKSSICIEQHEL
ncbi:acid protease [Aaosphaeria arxii CBS 175.79]|uniref:Acid protease n=1 Tax=Aaosphaeria arxii CBS 175.79 TaxID=1450172 RepID=A0A6A5XES3_9PLEO|nr:acid protease [Aaosphaeria arxii CBS 175.79]KAF2011413.1 acid protease [Aaosphaeria arxii CBS 175.79]